MEAILDAITTTYMECPQCGQKALSVATRCPHCGVAFPSKPLRRSTPSHRRNRLRPVLAVGGALLLGVALLAVVAPRLRVKAAPTARAASSAETAPTPLAAVVTDSTIERPPSVANPLATRVARTWVNVRGGPGRTSPTVRVLNPGDAVQVDSLNRGWYRVLIDGRAAGYVHRSNLDPVSPPR